MYYVIHVDFSNYEHIVKANQNIPQCGQNQLSDEVKFKVVSDKRNQINYLNRLYSDLTLCM